MNDQMPKIGGVHRSVQDWSIDDVALWLEENRLSDYKTLFCDEHRIDGSVLLSLTEDDLRKPPVQLTVLGMYNLCSYVSPFCFFACIRTWANQAKCVKLSRWSKLGFCWK